MAENFKMRWAVVILVTLVGVVWVAPNFVNMPESWPFSTKKMVMGLDIQGGIHLVLGVDTKAVLVQKTTRMVYPLNQPFSCSQYNSCFPLPPLSTIVAGQRNTVTTFRNSIYS